MSKLPEPNIVAVIEARLACLTRRERDILDLIMSGMRTKEIADTLGISVKTVEGHRAHLLRRMHVSTTTELSKIVTAIVSSDEKT
jgi:two-component system, LuxR family, response regulator DctR